MIHQGFATTLSAPFFMEVLFCYLNEAGSSQEIDWKEEADAAEEFGFQCHSFSFDLFLDGRLEAALDELPDGGGNQILYRGWLISEDDYGLLEDGLTAKGYQMVSGVHEYRETLLLPNYYELIEDLTPPALWTDEPDIDEAWELALQLGSGPWIIKDHIKSAKEAWLEACYIPAGADFDHFKQVCEELRDRREPNFTNGYVVRPYLPLKQLGVHWTGGPVAEEYRLIFWEGELISCLPYHEIGAGENPDFSEYKVLGERIDSSFFVADIAITENGSPTLIELNPGGAAGFPPQMHPVEFYSLIAGEPS